MAIIGGIPHFQTYPLQVSLFLKTVQDILTPFHGLVRKKQGSGRAGRAHSTGPQGLSWNGGWARHGVAIFHGDYDDSPLDLGTRFLGEWWNMSPRLSRWFLGSSSLEQVDTAKKLVFQKIQKSWPKVQHHFADLLVCSRVRESHLGSFTHLPSGRWLLGSLKGWQSKGQAEVKVQVAAMGDMPNGDQGKWTLRGRSVELGRRFGDWRSNLSRSDQIWSMDWFQGSTESHGFWLGVFEGLL